MRSPGEGTQLHGGANWPQHGVGNGYARRESGGDATSVMATTSASAVGVYQADLQRNMQTVHPVPAPPPRHASASISSPFPSYTVTPSSSFQGLAKKTMKKMDAVEYFEIDANCLDFKHVLTNEGGLGEVWEGRLREGGQEHKVAIKKYPSAFAEEEIEMFRRETSVLFMAATRCHNVCKVYGTTMKDNKMCIVMKLYKESMTGLMRRYPECKLPMQEVRRYGCEICKAVAELHEQNIISQDLKPPNFLIDELDHCVVADFGISKIVHGTLGHMPSNVQGTFNYMSPEAFDPEQFGGVTKKADSWSFACCLLEMMTGVKPWNGIKMAPIVRKVMNREIPEIPPGMPPPLEKIFRGCFSFQPEERPTFQTMFRYLKSDEGWTPQPQESLSASTDILRPISGLFDVFRTPQKQTNARPQSQRGGHAQNVASLSWGGVAGASEAPGGGGSGSWGGPSQLERGASLLPQAEATVHKLFHQAQEAARLQKEVEAAKKEAERERATAQAAAAQQQEVRRELESLRKEAEAEKRRHAEAHQALTRQLEAERRALAKRNDEFAKVREDCDHQLAQWIAAKESTELQDQQVMSLQKQAADLRRLLSAKQDEKSALEVEVEELRQTLRDRSTDDNREKEDIIHLSERIAELESDRTRVESERARLESERAQWHEQRQQLSVRDAALKGDAQEYHRRAEQAEGEVRRLEKSLAELVNEKRVWELERCEFNETLAQIQRRYQEERAALEGKVHEIESAFDQAIELELRRRTPDRQAILGGPLSIGSRSSRGSRTSSVSLDFEAEEGEEGEEGDGIDLDEDMLRLLGSLPQEGAGAADSDSSSKEEAERLCQLAARAQLEGRDKDAEALCQLAYDVYRGRGATALEAFRNTPPNVRQLMMAGICSPNSNSSSPNTSPPQPGSSGAAQHRGTASALAPVVKGSSRGSPIGKAGTRAPSPIVQGLGSRGYRSGGYAETSSRGGGGVSGVARAPFAQDESTSPNGNAPSPPSSSGFVAAQQVAQLQQWSMLSSPPSCHPTSSSTELLGTSESSRESSRDDARDATLRDTMSRPPPRMHLAAGMGKQGTEATSDPLAKLASGGGTGTRRRRCTGSRRGGGVTLWGGGAAGGGGGNMKSPRGGGGGSGSGGTAGGGHAGGEGVSLGLYLDGARISGVAAGTPAHRAGLQEGDEIKQVHGAPVNPQTCRPMLSDSAGEGDSFNVLVLRKQRLIEVTLQIQAKNATHSGQIVNRNSGREVML